jgi:hypothetical protein
MRSEQAKKVANSLLQIMVMTTKIISKTVTTNHKFRVWRTNIAVVGENCRHSWETVGLHALGAVVPAESDTVFPASPPPAMYCNWISFPRRRFLLRLHFAAGMNYVPHNVLRTTRNIIFIVFFRDSFHYSIKSAYYEEIASMGILRCKFSSEVLSSGLFDG